MAEYRHIDTGEVKTQGAWRSHYKNVSLPRTWTAATLAGLKLEPVFETPKPTAGQYQNAVRNGVEKDAKGNWVWGWAIRDMFTSYTDEEGVFQSKLEQEQAYQAGLDAKVAETNRAKRDGLLAETDWTQMNDSPLANELKTAWATYRQELRMITDLDAWPNLQDEDWPVQP
jgi:hypothetical protein